MTKRTRAQLVQEVASTLADNTDGDILPSGHRALLVNFLDSLFHQDDESDVAREVLRDRSAGLYGASGYRDARQGLVVSGYSYVSGTPATDQWSVGTRALNDLDSLLYADATLPAIQVNLSGEDQAVRDIIRAWATTDIGRTDEYRCIGVSESSPLADGWGTVPFFDCTYDAATDILTVSAGHARQAKGDSTSGDVGDVDIGFWHIIDDDVAGAIADDVESYARKGVSGTLPNSRIADGTITGDKLASGVLHSNAAIGDIAFHNPPLDLTGSQQKAVRGAIDADDGVKVLSADAASPPGGDLWYRSDLHEFRGSINGTVRTIGGIAFREPPTDLTAAQKSSVRSAIDAAGGVPVVSADPASPADGELWYRSDLDEFRGRIGGVSKTIAVRELEVLNTFADIRVDATTAVSTNGYRTIGFSSGDVLYDYGAAGYASNRTNLNLNNNSYRVPSTGLYRARMAVRFHDDSVNSLAERLSVGMGVQRVGQNNPNSGDHAYKFAWALVVDPIAESDSDPKDRWLAQWDWEKILTDGDTYSMRMYIDSDSDDVTSVNLDWAQFQIRRIA